MINNTLPPVKPNDWFVLNTLYPKATFDDFKTMAVTTENTDLKPKDFYREQPAVNKIFQDDHKNFDEMAFNTYYDGLVSSFNDFSQEPYEIKDFTQNVIYSPYNYMAPLLSRKESYEVKISQIFNTNQQKIGIFNPELWQASEFSEREIAQTQKVKHFNGTDLGFTPNDSSKSGIFDFFYDRLFGTKDILVLAQWDEDGTHIDPYTNEEVSHKKDERKYNEYGKPFYETLGGRNPVNKTVLSPWDTITTDGSWQNKFDFMDSDGKNKTIAGTLLKSAARIVPYFIPGVGETYALFTAGFTALEFLPQIGTMVGKFISGEDFTTTDIYKYLNYTQGLGQSLSNSSVSDHSMSNIWTWENLFTLVPEVFIQLKQQRQLGNLPKRFKTTSADARQLKHLQDKAGPEKLKQVKDIWAKAEKMQDFSEAQFQKHLALLQSGDKEIFELYKGWVNFENKIAKGLAIGYMTGASAGDVDQVIEQFNVQGRDAAWMKLGVLAAFWTSMSTMSFGDWAVQYTLGMDDAAKLLKKTVRDKAKDLSKLYGTIDDKVLTKQTQATASKIGAWNKLRGVTGSEFFQKGLETGKEIWEKFYSSGVTASMMKETLEEMSEETFTDLAKGIYNLFYDLNLTQNKDTKIDWEDDETLSRYAMAGLGGALGGALFHANDRTLSPIRKETMKTDFGTVIVDMVRNNQANEVYEQIENIRKSKRGFASKNLSFSVYNKIAMDDGTTQIKFEPVSEKALSQNDVIANTLKLQVELVEKAIFEGKIPSDQEIQDVFSQRTASLLEVSMHTAIEDDLKKYTTEYIELYDKLNTLSNTDTKNPQDEQRVKELYLELQTKQRQIQNITSEEQIGEYYSEALFNLDKVLNSTYAQKALDEEDGAKILYNKNYNELNEDQQSRVNNYLANDNIREKLRLKKKLFDAQEKILSSKINDIWEQLNLRSKFLQVAKAIDFDYTWNEDSVDLDVSNLVPQYSKQGLPEYLKVLQSIDYSKSLEEQMQENVSFQKAMQFRGHLNDILKLQATNPNQLTEDDYALLKFLNKALQNIKFPSFDRLGIDRQLVVDFARQNSEVKTLEDDFGYPMDETNAEFLWDVPHDLFNLQLYAGSEYVQSMGSDHFGLIAEKVYLDYILNHNLPVSQMLVSFWEDYQQIQRLNLQPEQKSALDSLISQLDVQYNSDTKHILDLVEQERTRMLEKPLEEYINTSEITARELERQLEQINRISTIIYAHMNFTTTPDTQIGYFPALNEYYKRNKIYKDYVVFDTNQGLVLLDYLDYIYNKLEYLKSLSDFNQRSKIPNKERSELRMLILQQRDLLNIMQEIQFPNDNITFKEFLEKNLPKVYERFFQLENDPKVIADKLEEITSEETGSRREKIEEITGIVMQTEHLIHQQFSQLDVEQKKIVVESIIEKLDAKSIIATVVSEHFTSYDKNTKQINELDKFMHVASVLVGDSLEFLKDYNTLITTESIPFGLFGDQQQQLKLTHMLNQGVFSQAFGKDPQFKLKDVIDIFKLKFKDQFFLSEDKNYLDNILFVYGIQGTGKTTAILDFLSRTLSKRGLNSVALATQANIAEKLLNTVVNNKVTNIEDQNLNSLFNLLFGAENHMKLEEALEDANSNLLTMTEAAQDKQVFHQTVVNYHHPVIVAIMKELAERQKYSLRLGKDPIHVILIDESTQIPNIKMVLLNEFVKLYNSKADQKLTIVTTGDWRQVGAITELQDEQKQLQSVNISAQQLFNIRSIDLNSSIRTANNVKEFNSSQLSHLAEISTIAMHHSDDVSVTLKQGFKEDLPYGEFSVNYNEVGSSYQDIVNNLLEKQVLPEDIVLIGDKDNTSMKSLAAEKGITFVTKDMMNGIEFDYVVADININPKVSFAVYTKYMNTVLTRSRKATYLNSKSFNKYSNLFKFITEPEIFDTSITEDRVNEYKSAKIHSINRLANKLLGAQIVSDIPEYTKPAVKKSTQSPDRFNQSEHGQEIVVSDKDLQELALGSTDPSTSVFNQNVDNPPFLQTYIRHGFGLAEKDSTGRNIFSPKNRLRNINLIRSRAKQIFLKNLYSSNPKPIQEQKQELLEKINQEVAGENQVVDFDLVLYNRPQMDEDVFLGDNKYKNVLVYSMKLKLSNDTTFYLPLAAQGEKLVDFIRANRVEEYDSHEDIMLNPDKIIQFLSPNTNSYLFFKQMEVNGKLVPTKKDYIPVKQLRAEGFVVSPVYVIHHSFKNDDLTKAYNGKEFVLVSSDPSLTPDSLFDVFKTELNQAQNNEKIKNSLSKEDIIDKDLDAFGLSDSRVKLVFLNRTGFEFYDGTNNDWLSKIKQGRKETNFLTVRSLADSYITSTMFRELAARYDELLKQHSVKGQEFSQNLVPEQDRSFVLFYQDLVFQLKVLAEYPEGESNLLKNLRNVEGLSQITNRIAENLSKQKNKDSRDALFTQNHLFLFLFDAVMEGGTVKSPISEKVYQFQTTQSSPEEKIKLKKYINSVFEQSKAFTESSTGKYGIWYTAQIAKGNQGEQFQYIQNVDEEQLNNFTVPPVFPGEIYLRGAKHILFGEQTQNNSQPNATKEVTFKDWGPALKEEITGVFKSFGFDDNTINSLLKVYDEMTPNDNDQIPVDAFGSIYADKLNELNVQKDYASVVFEWQNVSMNVSVNYPISKKFSDFMNAIQSSQRMTPENKDAQLKDLQSISDQGNLNPEDLSRISGYLFDANGEDIQELIDLLDELKNDSCVPGSNTDFNDDSDVPF